MNLESKFACVQMTDVGKVRDHNEDAIGASLSTGLLVLADGMGGYNAGEVASGIAVKTVLELVTEACQREARTETASPMGISTSRRLRILKPTVTLWISMSTTATSASVSAFSTAITSQLVCQCSWLVTSGPRFADSPAAFASACSALSSGCLCSVI